MRSKASWAFGATAHGRQQPVDLVNRKGFTVIILASQVVRKAFLSRLPLELEQVF